MTTSPVMTVTDELLAELEEITSRQPGANLVVRSSSMNLIYSELRRLRAENAELANLLSEAGKTIHKLQAEQPTPARIVRYLDAMRAKIDAIMAKRIGAA